jgi:dyslexia susceptibility 1 candidate gene 1 protein
VVKFNFTPRIFPTPMRESKACEEEDWVAKNRTHLRRNPQLKPQLDALDIEDSDPTWLKGKVGGLICAGRLCWCCLLGGSRERFVV